MGYALIGVRIHSFIHSGEYPGAWEDSAKYAARRTTPWPSLGRTQGRKRTLCRVGYKVNNMVRGSVFDWLGSGQQSIGPVSN
jgi:hypothetical protein